MMAPIWAEGRAAPEDSNGRLQDRRKPSISVLGRETILVDTAIRSSRRHSRARKIRIDVAPSRAARCRRVTLGQRRETAVVIVRSPGPHVQANRKIRIVHLGRRRPYRDRPDRQNRKGQNAHKNLLGNWWLGGQALPHDSANRAGREALRSEAIRSHSVPDRRL